MKFKNKIKSFLKFNIDDHNNILLCIIIIFLVFITPYNKAIQALNTDLNALSWSITQESPKAPLKPKFSLVVANITHYTASKDETDGNPCETADGTNICQQGVEPIAANNCLPFNTKVEFNGIIYRIADRMNFRYGCNWYDLLVADKATAKSLGVLYNKEVKIYK